MTNSQPVRGKQTFFPMQSTVSNIRPMQGRLKRSILCYLAAVLIFTVIFSFIILCGKYRDSLSFTVDMLNKGRSNLVRMRDAGGRADALLSDIKAAVPARALSGTPEELLLAGLDDLKEKIRDGEITVENIEQKGDEAALPVQFPKTAALVCNRSASHFHSKVSRKSRCRQPM